MNPAHALPSPLAAPRRPLPGQAGGPSAWPRGVRRATEPAWLTHSPSIAPGHPGLQGFFPQGGWCAQSLTELHSPAPGLDDWRLLAPVWAHTSPHGAPWAWVLSPQWPCTPHVPAWLERGLSPTQLRWIHPRTEAEGAWAVEQLLNARAVAGVWWMANEPTPLMRRRVQRAAQLAGRPVWLSRPLAGQDHPSPAPWRLTLQPLAKQQLQLRWLKCPGPAWPAARVLNLQDAGPSGLLPAAPPPVPRPGVRPPPLEVPHVVAGLG